MKVNLSIVVDVAGLPDDDGTGFVQEWTRMVVDDRVKRRVCDALATATVNGEMRISVRNHLADVSVDSVKLDVERTVNAMDLPTPGNLSTYEIEPYRNVLRWRSVRIANDGGSQARVDGYIAEHDLRSRIDHATEYVVVMDVLCTPAQGVDIYAIQGVVAIGESKLETAR